MSAWNVTKLWTDNEVAAYGLYAATEGPKKATNGLRSTCEDLAIRIVTEFASKNGLPVYFVNGAHDKGITPEGYGNPTEFLNEVLPSTGASDLPNYDLVTEAKGAPRGDSTSLRVAKAGDLILLFEGTRAHHVQLVTSVGSQVVKIAQGSFRPASERCYDNASDPNAVCYIGAIVAEKSYSLRVSGQWLYDDGNRDLFKDENCRLMRWSFFDKWNKQVIKYTVKNGDNAYTIATNVYGNASIPTVASVNTAVTEAMRASGGKLSPASPLYLWK